MNFAASATPASAPGRDTSRDAFEFVSALATELSGGAIELPSFPEVAMRVQRILAEESSSCDRVVRVLGAEPMLAARVLALANSAALSPGGPPATELRAAVQRLGFDALRTAAVSFAMAQLRRAQAYRGIERQLNVLWQHSVQVACNTLVIARGTGRVNQDTAMFTGLIHGVGKLYILTRAERYQALFADHRAYGRLVRDWHANIAKALLENWNTPEEIVAAVHSYEDPERDARGGVGALADVLALAELLATCRQHPEMLPEKLAEEKACARLGLDAPRCSALLAESVEEMNALRAALG
jgi:HD-like signal output (HDOD) protein